MLQHAGVDFDVVPARVDEDAIKDSLLAEKADPAAVADALAELKAVKVSASREGVLVLGADQVLNFEGELISKCQTLEEARALLMRLRGNSHELISAAVLALNGAPTWRFVGCARLWMRAFSDDFLEDYIAQEGENLLMGVGCYKLEGLGAQLFERVDGDTFTILGLPLFPLLSALREQGVLSR
ncbi:MAG: Maf family protein [Proteobacteria bacterium]|nr:Maf family protein [Pseudomonadota bacterium]